MEMTKEQFSEIIRRGRGQRQEFFRDAWMMLAFNGISGDYLEFGSHGGSTFVQSFEESRAVGHRPHLWAFDSFMGLPDSEGVLDRHPMWSEGKMTTSLIDFREVCGAASLSSADYSTVEGFYSDTLPELSKTGEPTDVSLAYIDCDLYSSTVSVLDFLEPRLKHGMLLAFDDYYCYSPELASGEKLAFDQFCEDQLDWDFVPYARIGWSGMSFIVEGIRRGTGHKE